MKDTFRFYYEGEEHMLFDRLNEQFLHAIFMTTVSLICITICKRFALADPNSIVLDILNTFACFTFWEICNTYYTRRKHFTKLEQVKISKDAEIRFAE